MINCPLGSQAHAKVPFFSPLPFKKPVHATAERPAAGFMTKTLKRTKTEICKHVLSVTFMKPGTSVSFIFHLRSSLLIDVGTLLIVCSHAALIQPVNEKIAWHRRGFSNSTSSCHHTRLRLFKESVQLIHHAYQQEVKTQSSLTFKIRTIINS